MSNDSETTGTETSVTPSETPAPSKKAGLIRWIITGAVCAGLGLGGYMFGQRSGAVAADDLLATTVVVDSEGHPVDVVVDPAYLDRLVCPDIDEDPAQVAFMVDLPAMHVNLHGGHYLRVAVSLGISDQSDLDTPEEFVAAPALDAIVATLSGREMGELQTTEGRDAAKDQLTDRIVTIYEDDVLAVFLTEFVMQ